MTTYKDKKGYERYEKEHTDLVHRNRAYHIYLQNRDKYPLPYSAYEVHHKDFDKTNNKVNNLQILTPSEHDKIHEEENKKRTQKEKDIQAYDELIAKEFREKNLQIIKPLTVKELRELRERNAKEFGENNHKDRLSIENPEGDLSVLTTGKKENSEKHMGGEKKPLVKNLASHPLGFQIIPYLLFTYVFSIIVFNVLNMSTINKELNPFTYIFSIYQVPFFLVAFVVVSIIAYLILMSWWIEIIRRRIR